MQKTLTSALYLPTIVTQIQIALILMDHISAHVTLGMPVKVRKVKEILIFFNNKILARVNHSL